MARRLLRTTATFAVLVASAGAHQHLHRFAQTPKLAYYARVPGGNSASAMHILDRILNQGYNWTLGIRPVGVVQKDKLLQNDLVRKQLFCSNSGESPFSS
jgi:hypothetical protein